MTKIAGPKMALPKSPRHTPGKPHIRLRKLATVPKSSISTGGLAFDTPADGGGGLAFPTTPGGFSAPGDTEG